MSRNRRSQSAAVRFGPVLKAMLLCLIIGGAGVGYVWQKNQVYDLGRQIQRSEMRLEDLRRQNKRLNDWLAELRSPRALDERVKKLNLGLVPTQPRQTIRITDIMPKPEFAGGGRPVTTGVQLVARPNLR
jgi:hypothetical protein